MTKYLLLILLAIFSSIDAIDGSGSSSASKRRRLSSEHPSAKRYACDRPDCKKTFTNSSNFKTHMLVHTGEKPFVCDYAGCGSAFARQGNLNVHKKRIREKGLIPVNIQIATLLLHKAAT